jgi:RNA polymerase sigma-70 factor, ECF subfamily
LKTALSDEELVARYCTSNDLKAFEQLVCRYLPTVRSLAFQMLLDDSQADDVTQEAFLKAQRGIHSFRGDSTFSTWLYRVAMNTAYNFLRDRSRSALVYCSVMPAAESSGDGPDQAAIQAELAGEIEAAIVELSPKLRASIVLTCLQGLSSRQAAEIENCTEATMNWRVHQARQQLKAKLGKYIT